MSNFITLILNAFTYTESLPKPYSDPTKGLYIFCIYGY